MTRPAAPSRSTRLRPPTDRERIEHQPRCECGKCGQMTIGHPVHVSLVHKDRRHGHVRDCTAYFSCCRVLVHWSIATTPDGLHDGERVEGPAVHAGRAYIDHWLRYYPELRVGD